MNHSYIKKKLPRLLASCFDFKRKLFFQTFFICFTFLFSFSGNAQSTIHLGSGGGSETSYIPIYSYYNYNYSQTIYTAEEMNVLGADTAAFITKIWYLSKYSMETDNWKDWKIYMGNTSKTGFLSNDTWIPASSMTLVFDGEIATHVVDGQWLEISLTTPFEWDGSSNIVVAVNETTPGYSSSNYWASYTVTTPNLYKSIYYYSDSNLPDPFLPPNSSNKSNNVPQIRFTGNLLPDCYGVPTAGIIESSEVSVCSNMPFSLAMEGATTAGNLESKWQNSVDSGGTWNDIPGSDYLNLIYLNDGITQNTMFRYYVKCLSSNQESFSNEIQLTVNDFLTCYCEPEGDDFCYDIEFNAISMNGLVDTGLHCDPSYENRSSSQNMIPSLMQGATIPMSVDVKGEDYGDGEYSSVVLGAWIDFNQNGIFDTSEFFYFGEGFEETLTKNIIIPIDAEPGNTLMRVKSSSYEWAFSESACDDLSYSYGMVRDYTVNIQAAPTCSGQPIAGVISGPDSVCLSSPLELQISGQTIAQDMHYTWEMSEDGGVTWTSIANSNMGVDYVLEDGITQVAQFRHKVKCLNSGLENYSNVITIEIKDFLSCYCLQEELYCNEFNSISKISLLDLVDSGLSCTPIYEDRSDVQNVIPQLIIDATSVLTVEGGNGYDSYVAAWIDFNQNGVFDADEAFDLGLMSQLNASLNLEIPLNAMVGITKMRIQCSDYYIDLNDACSQWNYGPIRDYLVEIVAPVLCNNTPEAGIIAAPSSVCSSSPFSVSTSGATYASGLESIWQISEDGGQTWSDIVASENNLFFSLDDGINVPSYFRFIISCSNNGLSDTSNNVFVDIKPFNECYCSPSSTSYYSASSWVESVSTTGALQNISNLNTGASTAGYGDYTLTHIIETELGSSFNFEITTKNSSVSGLMIWIDWNQNGIFESDERVYYNTFGSNNNFYTYTGTIQVPGFALPGTTRMRVKNYYYYSSTLPCEEVYSSEAEDYSINVLAPPPCVGAPNPGLLTIDSLYCYSNLKLEVTGFDKGLDLSGVMQKSIDSGATWTNLPYAGNDSVYYTSITVPTSFRFLNSCSSSGLDSVSNIIEAEINHMNCYCTPTISNSSINYRIESVSTTGGVTNISNLNTGLTTGGYTDYSNAHMLEAYWDQTIDFSIRAYNASFPGIKIWIDWNQNGVFDNDELVYTSTSGYTYYTNEYTGSFQVPLTAIPGDTKMRIRNIYNGNSPCNSTAYGETEDYLVRVNEVPDCSGLPQLGLASTIDSVCPEISFVLDVQDIGFYYGLEGVWQMSSDNGQTWIDIANSNGQSNFTLTDGISQTTDYRYKLSCTNGGQVNYSNVFSVNVKDYNDCYCAPVFTYNGYYLKQITMNGSDSSSIDYLINTTPNFNGIKGYDLRLSDTLTQAQGLEVDFSTLFYANDHSLKIWIDYDKNGQFNELEELVYSQYSLYPQQSNSFLIPYSLPLGTYRMRVAAVPYDTNFVSCPSMYYGTVVDFTLEVIQAPSCVPAAQLKAENISSTTAEISWTNLNDTPNQMFEVEYGFKGFTIGSGTIQYVDTAYVLLNGLSINTEYDLYVRKICNIGDTSDYSNSLGFLTRQVFATIPYIEEFSTNDFTFVNGTSLNQWSYGSAEGNPGNSLYISKDGGLNNSYDIYSQSLVHAFRDIEIPSNVDRISLEFDWKGNGESCCDYLQVWLVPDTFMPIAGNNIQASVDHIQIYGRFSNNIDWTTYRDPIIDISNFSGSVMRLVFEWRNNNSYGAQKPAAIDNIKIESPSCFEPTQLNVSNITASTANLSWVANNAGNLFEIEYGESGFTVGNGIKVYSTTNSVQLTNLDDNTGYIAYVREICGLGDTSLAVVSSEIRTLQIPAVLPYFDDFTTNEFTFINGNYPNRWEHGSATGNAAPSLYISNDGGLTNSYTINSSSTVQAYRDIVIPQGATFASFSFDWKGQGENNYDYLRVWLTPNNYIPNGLITTSSNRFIIGGSFLMSNVWQTYSEPLLDISMFAGQTVRLFFEWRNDNISGTQTPAAIDNISIFIPSCHEPSQVVASNITPSSIDLSWVANNAGNLFEIEYGEPGFTVGNGMKVYSPTNSVQLTNLDDNTVYIANVREICGSGDTSLAAVTSEIRTLQIPATIPYFDDFTTNQFTFINKAYVNRWEHGNATGNVAPSLYISNDGGLTNSYSINTSSTVHAYRDIEVPQGATFASFSFDWKGQGENNYDYLRVWLTPNNYIPNGLITTSSNRFIIGGNFSMSNVWQTYSEPLLDISMFEGQTVRLFFEWRNDGSYGIQTPAAIDNVSFTIPTCFIPDHLTSSNISHESATISWNGNNIGSQFELQYGHEGFNVGSGTSIFVSDTLYHLANLNSITKYDVYVRQICDMADSSDWVGPVQFKTLCPPYFTAPFFEDFNNGSLPECWTIESDGGSSSTANWRFGSGVNYEAANNGRPEGTYAWVDASAPYQNIHEVILTTPFVKISQLTSPSLEFEWFKNHAYSQQFDNNKLSVEIRDQMGWTEMWSSNSNSPEWRSVFIPLDNLVGDSIQVRFIVDKDVNGNGYYYDDLLLDNVQIKESNHCFGQPSTAGATASVDSICENAPIELSLYSNILGIDYQWQKSAEGLNSWVDINGADTNEYHLINGITENTDFRIIATCISSGLSDTSSVINVKTIKNILHLNKTFVAFGDVVIHDTVIQTVVIQNTCVTPMQILSATAALDMTVNLSNSTIAPGQSIVAQIIFNPQNGLNYSDSLRIVTSNRTYAIPVTGKGVNPAPAWTLTPTSFNYGNVIVNQDSVRSFTIKNIGNVPIELGNISSSNPAFEVISAPQNLAKLANGTITISFQPNAVATYNGTVAIESNTSNLSPLLLNLNGMGYIPSSTPTISYNANYPFNGNSGVDKQVGIPGTYTYSMVYSHPDNVPPMQGYPQIGIDYNGDHDFIDNNEGVYTLSQVGNGTDWLNGEIFEFTTVLPLGSTFGYQFFAKDELGNVATSQIVNYHSAPLVTNQSLDLSIYANDITFSDNNPDVNQNFQVFANINNNSPYHANDVPISFYMDSVLIGRDTIPFIAANSSMNISRNLNFNADGFYPIKVWVDSSQTLNENNVLNNYAIRPVIVGNFSLPGSIQTSVNKTTATCPYPRVNFNGYATYSGLNLVGTPPALGATVTLHILGDTTLTTNTVTNGYWSINWNQLSGGMQCGVTYNYELVVTDYTLTSVSYTGSFTTPCYNCNPQTGGASASSTGGIDLVPCTQVDNYLPYIIKLKNLCNGTDYFNDTTKVYIDNNLIATFTSATLLKCDSIVYNGSYLFSSPGEYQLKYISKHYDDNGNPREIINSKPVKVEGKPDLMISNFQKLNSTTFKFKNRNVANCVPAGHHWVHVYDSTASSGQYNLIASYEVHGLSSNSSLPITYSNPNFEMGYHYLRIVTDALEEVDEYNESNNVLNVAFYVPYPELEMTDIKMSNSNITAGSLVNFTAKVTNTGGSAEPFHVQFYDGNLPIGSPVFVNGLASNQNVTVVSPIFTVPSEECPIWIRAVADVNNVNTELNKENNLDTLAVAYDFISGEYACNKWGSACKPYIVIKDTENQFFSSVKNIGTRDAFDIVKVRFEVDSQTIGYDNIAGGIPSLIQKETNVFHTFEDTGKYIIKVYPNYDSQYCELTDTNNVGKIHVKVIDSYPDLYLFSQHISPSNLNPNPGQSVNVVASVFNSGLVPSTPTTVRFWVDDVQLGIDVPLDVIDAGADTTVAATLPYSSNLIGPKIIKVKADAEDLVVELNKMNNTATRSIIVGAAPDIASSIHEAITLSTESPRVNEPLIVSNYIRNYGGDGGTGYIHFYVHDEDGNQTLLNSEQFALGSGDSTKISFTWTPQALGQTMITSEITNVIPQEFNELNNFDTLEFHVGRYLKINDVIISSNHVCEGDSVLLAASVSSEGQPLTYEWMFNGTALANSNSLNLAISNAQASNAGLYAFRVTDEGNTKVSQSMSLTVNPPIQLITQPDASLTLCEGKVIELNVDAQNVANYDWKYNGAGIGQYSSSLFIQEALPSNSGNYHVDLLGLPGCSNVSSQISNVVVQSLDNALIDIDAVDSFEQKANVNYHYSDDDCKLLASVFNGNQDLGNTRVHTIVDTSLVGYVARYTDIHPENNNLPADVTLYFKQSEFDAYNAWATIEGKPLLPQSPTDTLNIPNLTINQFHGLPTDGNTGPNQSYDATNYEYITNGIIVNWDSNKQLWVVQFPVSSFSGFFVGTFKNNPFPIKLISIQATNRGAINTVEWKTASEGKGDYFELERSSDGKTFEKIGTIAAKGRASTYFYDDLNPIIGNNYYRLKMYDASGIFAQYSKIVEAQVKEVKGITLTAYPNPTSDKVEVNIIGKISNSAQMTLTDINGRILETIQVTENKETIDLSSYATGVYLIKYTDKNTTQTIKVVRE